MRSSEGHLWRHGLNTRAKEIIHETRIMKTGKSSMSSTHPGREVKREEVVAAQEAVLEEVDPGQLFRQYVYLRGLALKSKIPIIDQRNFM